ncbi:kinase-like domain-containing protein [Aspergillus germanicus]
MRLFLLSPLSLRSSSFRPRAFPESGFDTIDPTVLIEEKTLPGYLAEQYYPARIGEVFNSRYQILTKLGFGSASTVWLCRDLKCYRVLKVHVRSRRPPQEIEVLKHLRSLPGDEHPGGSHVRLPLDFFEVIRPHGVHPCLLYAPAGVDIRDFMSCLENDALPEELLRPTIRYVLLALDYLLRGNIIHTDEVSNPSPRKQLPDRTIYATRGMPVSTGQPVLSDLGEARIADSGNQAGLVMPSVYRAPEVMLGMDQMAWTLFEKGHLFKTRNLDNESDHAIRYAEMIALLGPARTEFLKRSEISLKFWDENGNWRSLAEIPTLTLEERESRLEGDTKTLFLEFLRKTLQWRPEDRPTVEKLLADKWVRGNDY